jgi:hypothetical protein
MHFNCFDLGHYHRSSIGHILIDISITPIRLVADKVRANQALSSQKEIK